MHTCALVTKPGCMPIKGLWWHGHACTNEHCVNWKLGIDEAFKVWRGRHQSVGLFAPAKG